MPKKCQKCSKHPSFGVRGTKVALFCRVHKTDDMVDVTHMSCEFNGCHVRPNFGTKGTKIAHFCAVHKADDMVNVKDKTCEFERCLVQPTFGLKESKVALMCVEHRTAEMINVKGKTCEFAGCQTQPTFGYSWTKIARFCAVHKADDMVNVKSRTCEFEGCQKQPTFGTKRNNARFCAVHKADDMVDVTNKICEFAGCQTQPTFGYSWTKIARFCAVHKADDMLDVINKICEFTGCQIQPRYGLPGSKPSRCAKHRQSGMINSPRRRCLEPNCRELAIYGMDTHEHCERHKLEDEINIMERECTSCHLLGIVDAKGLCDTCDPITFQRVRLAKQNAVEHFLRAANVPLTSVDKTIDGGVCGKERPDFFIDCGTHVLIIEVDENQHSGRPCECEQTRMVNISQSNGIKTFFLRYNPDKYKNSAMESTVKRLDTLLRWTRHHMENIPEHFLSVQYLYFDGYNPGDHVIEKII